MSDTIEITIKGNPRELVDFFGTFEEGKSAMLIRQIAPLVAKRISLSDIIKTESAIRDCTVAELAKTLNDHLKAESKSENSLR